MTGIFLQSPGIFPVFGPGCPEDLATCGEECEQNPGWECWEWMGVSQRMAHACGYEVTGLWRNCKL